jgi:hypothetical protein
MCVINGLSHKHTLLSTIHKAHVICFIAGLFWDDIFEGKIYVVAFGRTWLTHIVLTVYYCLKDCPNTINYNPITINQTLQQFKILKEIKV